MKTSNNLWGGAGEKVDMWSVFRDKEVVIYPSMKQISSSDVTRFPHSKSKDWFSRAGPCSVYHENRSLKVFNPIKEVQ